MHFRLVLDSDNAAFDDIAAYEVARILRVAAEKFENGGAGKVALRDINGNTVGFAELSID